ncbi:MULTISPECIES: hypothetical protein [unclassified Salipiger]|uniref:hypothetical protein n=1 Tax=unclassified Salipiger TaxID=2640570 RepID=UPI0013B99A72|nr:MULTISPECIES: hypothetical protein [unclassified Salipiger]NDV51378.1 hypothetical protein [Salipiger sp. PrR003]NDW32971.1 hypothetical protein [Salipiger sp. PrR007]
MLVGSWLKSRAIYDRRRRYTTLTPTAFSRADLINSSAMDLQVELVDRGPARTLRLPSAMLLPDWARWGARLVGFTRERAAIIYDERQFDEEDLPTSHQDLAPSFARTSVCIFFRIAIS